MNSKELKVKMFQEAIQRSTVAVRKGATVELVNGKLEYRILGYKATGTYKMRSNYREVLCMLCYEDIKAIMAVA